jgi:hypothetical protein
MVYFYESYKYRPPMFNPDGTLSKQAIFKRKKLALEEVSEKWVAHKIRELALFRIYCDTGRSRGERHQADVELRICERKLAYWERHPAFDLSHAMRQEKWLLARQLSSYEKLLALI